MFAHPQVIQKSPTFMTSNVSLQWGRIFHVKFLVMIGNDGSTIVRKEENAKDNFTIETPGTMLR